MEKSMFYNIVNLVSAATPQTALHIVQSIMVNKFFLSETCYLQRVWEEQSSWENQSKEMAKTPSKQNETTIDELSE